jgi:hypothetical protein
LDKLTDLSDVKKKILETVWESKYPLNSKQISDKTGMQPLTLKDHLQALRQEELVSVIGGNYTITAKGKEKLGFTIIDQMKAEKILSQLPLENAFFFYAEVDQPLGIRSDSLSDFCDKLQSIEIRSIEFHTAQGHIESWITFLGDVELAKKLKLLKEKNLKAEPLRETLYQTIKARLNELQKIKSQ